MDLKGKLRQGMRIFGSDDREYGTVERIEGDYAYVGGRRIPVSAFDRLDNDRVYVGRDGARHFADASAVATEGAIRVPVVEERLRVGKHEVDLGNVEIRKTVETEQVNVPVELMHEEVHVERVDVADRPIAAGDMPDAFKEGTIRVPVRGEEAIVSKQAFITDEVVIDRYRTTEQQIISDTVRKERVQVEENYQKARAGIQQHYAQNRGISGKPPFEEAEATYRTGFQAAHDPQFADREFDEVEPQLRDDWHASGSRGGAGWDKLREEIREGWNRARA